MYDPEELLRAWPLLVWKYPSSSILMSVILSKLSELGVQGKPAMLLEAQTKVALRVDSLCLPNRSRQHLPGRQRQIGLISGRWGIE